jgi:hypothetical protein
MRFTLAEIPMDKMQENEGRLMTYSVIELVVIALLIVTLGLDFLQIRHGVRLSLDNCHWGIGLCLLVVLAPIHLLIVREEKFVERDLTSRKNRRLSPLRDVVAKPESSHNQGDPNA